MAGFSLSGMDKLALFGATLSDVGGGLLGRSPGAVAATQGLLADRRDRLANAPLEEMKRKLALASGNRQIAAYGVADQMHLTPEEQFGVAFAPGEAGKTFLTGSEAYTGTPGSSRYFRGKMVSNNPVKAEPKMFGDYLYIPEEDGQPSAAPAAAPQAAPAPQAQPGADAVWSAMKQRESGGNGNAVSPKGALGSTQMLPATAQAMAQKLGVQWRPELMRGNSPEALQYQDQLGRAYFDEGVQRYGGDLSKGASYYHGGPNTAIWGPKTRAYAQAVTQGAPMAASGGQNPPMQGGPAQDDLAGAPQVPGYRLVGRVKGEGNGQVWTPDGKGLLINRNGDRKEDPAFKGAGTEVETPPGLTKIGARTWEDPVGRKYQPDTQGNMKQTYGPTDESVKAAAGGATSLNSVLAATIKYEAAVKALSPSDFGPTGKYLGDPAKFAAAQAAATNLMMLAKGPEMYGLGVITGPDMEILGGVVQDPSKWGAMFRNGQILPKLRSLAGDVGAKYEFLRQGFKAQGGNPSGLPELYGMRRDAKGHAVPIGQAAAAPAAAGKPAPAKGGGTPIKTKGGVVVHVGQPL